ncbi:hypothetical protein EZV62_003821 [Acer yangbiense]|uniref:BED-type domain-containing protein n=1 Tax=Acer yangbiense TaxID=1000413 RepID=A0A5C7IKA3_9ROSI|nr:hypothetical protein EZV62_003821 [Acer yangbiense]
MSWPSGSLPAIPPLFSDDNPHQQRQESSHIRQQNAGKETVGLDLGCSSSQMKNRKLRSNVWEHFHKYKDKDGNDRARCNLCDKDFDGSSKKGTTHLRNHFKCCQKKRNGAGDKPAEAGNSMNPIAIKEKSVMDQQLDSLDLTRMIVKYCVTSLDSLQELHAYNEERKKLRKYFEKLLCRFCLTIDEVPPSKDYYICFTVYFIDDDWKLKRNIISLVRFIEDDQIASKCLKKVLLELEINNNISSMVKNAYHSDMWYVNVRENRFIGQGSLLFNGKLLCIDSLKDICYLHPSMLFDIKWILHDRMSKIFNYITETSSKNETFRIAKDRAKSLGKEVTAEVIPTKQQLEDMTPLWNHENDSIVVLLEIALGFKEAFSELENMDPDFKSINLTKEQWDHIRDIYECYEDFTDESFLEHWSSYKTANINWSQSNLVLAVAAVLDPRFKMDVVKYWYKKIYGSEWETQLTTFRSYFTGIYNEYAKGTNDEKNSSISYKMLDPSGKPRKSSRDLDHNGGESILNISPHSQGWLVIS